MDNKLKEFTKMIDDAFDIVTEERNETEVESENSEAAEASPRRWETPDDYRAETNKRFRMTKEETAKYGSDEAGRLAAFNARQDAGLL